MRLQDDARVNVASLREIILDRDQLIEDFVPGQAVVMVKIAAKTDHGREVVITELVKDGDSVGNRFVCLAPTIVFRDLVAERGEEKIDAQTAGVRVAVLIEHVRLHGVFEIAVIDPDILFFQASPEVGLVAHDTAGHLQSESEAALESIVLRFAVDVLDGAGGFHPQTQRQLEGIQPIIRESDGPVRVMVEKETDACVISRRDRVLRLNAQGNMGIDRCRYDHVPGILNRVVAILEHESHPEFAAVTQAETAQNQQRAVEIAVEAVDIAHARPVGRLDALQIVQLKADSDLRVVADMGERRRTVVRPSQFQIIGKERRSDILPEKSRIIPAVVQSLAPPRINGHILRGELTYKSIQ